MVVMALVTVALFVVMVVMMLVTVALFVVMVVMVLVAVALSVVVVVMLVAVAILAVVMVMLVVMSAFRAYFLIFECGKLEGNTVFALHCQKKLLAAKLGYRSCNYNRISVMLSYKRNSLCNFRLRCCIGMAENYRICALYLVVEKFSEIFHIHFALYGINHSSCGIKGCRVGIKRLNCSYNVTELTYSRRLYYYSVG